MTNLDKAILRAQARSNARYSRLRQQYNRGLINNAEWNRLIKELETRQAAEVEAEFQCDEGRISGDERDAIIKGTTPRGGEGVGVAVKSLGSASPA